MRTSCPRHRPYQLAAFLSAATEAAQPRGGRTRTLAGEVLRQGEVAGRPRHRRRHASQKVVKDALLAAFPDHLFLGEEDVGRQVARGDAASRPMRPPMWVVDPLDGTANYVHDVPAYCVSIGLWAEGKPVVGVIHDPRMNEVFTAAVGLGAFLNGKPIRVSAVPLLARRDDLDRLPGELPEAAPQPRSVARRSSRTRSRCAAPARPR